MREIKGIVSWQVLFTILSSNFEKQARVLNIYTGKEKTTGGDRNGKRDGIPD